MISQASQHHLPVTHVAVAVVEEVPTLLPNAVQHVNSHIGRTAIKRTSHGTTSLCFPLLVQYTSELSVQLSSVLLRMFTVGPCRLLGAISPRPSVESWPCLDSSQSPFDRPQKLGSIKVHVAEALCRLWEESHPVPWECRTL
jgi:hypothetical protein